MNASPRALALAALVLVLPTGCSMFGGSKEPVSGVYEENEVTRTATVQKIDLANRLVTLKGDQSGDTVVVKASADVKNLPQLRVGDRVTATYYQSIAYEVHKPGTL